MSRFSIRFLLACLLLGFGIFFGVELASRGIERVHGPMQPTMPAAGTMEPTPAKPSVNIKPADKERNPPVASRQADPAQVITSDSLINHIANKTGTLLRVMAHYSIDIVISFFDGIFK